MSLINILDQSLLSGDLKFPLMDIVDRESEFTICADLPGVDKKDIELFIEDNMLTIKGEKKTVLTTATYSERSYGSFQRTITLPQNADINNISAEYRNGVLWVTVPKNIEISDTKIKVEIK
jgi:HSP20 family protein